MASTVFGNASENTSTQVTSYTTPTAGGSQVQGQGNSAVALSSTSGNLTLNQESPAAIAALQNTTNQALNSISAIAAGSVAQGSATGQNALDTAKNALKTQTQQSTPLLISGVVIAGIILAVIFFKKG